MKIQLNLNDVIFCKLTDYGRRVYLDYVESYVPEDHRHYFLKKLGEEKFSALLWEFANIFGIFLSQGRENVCEMNIEIEKML